MKFTLLLILLVAVMAKPQTNGSILGTLGKIAKYICDKISKKRGIINLFIYLFILFTYLFYLFIYLFMYSSLFTYFIYLFY